MKGHGRKTSTLFVMNVTRIQENFLQSLKEQIPEKTKLANRLADVLTMERASVHRRLRGEIPFTFNEAARIAKELNISLDKIILYNQANLERAGNMLLPLDDRPLDFSAMNLLLKKVTDIAHSGQAEYGMVCNCIPPFLSLNYEHLIRFYVFKRGYRYGQSSSYNRFEKIPRGDKMMELPRKLALMSKRFNSFICLWDASVIPNIVKDIQYFKHIRLISADDMLLIKQDLLGLLEEVELAASAGCFRETGCTFDLHLSNVSLKTSFVYGGSQSEWFTMIVLFSIHGITSFEEKTFRQFKEWGLYLKRFSTLLSGVGEKERFLFFEQQRAIVDGL